MTPLRYVKDLAKVEYKVKKNNKKKQITFVHSLWVDGIS
jgi:hypothetical protein